MTCGACPGSPRALAVRDARPVRRQGRAARTGIVARSPAHLVGVEEPVPAGRGGEVVGLPDVGHVAKARVHVAP